MRDRYQQKVLREEKLRQETVFLQKYVARLKRSKKNKNNVLELEVSQPKVQRLELREIGIHHVEDGQNNQEVIAIYREIFFKELNY